MEEAVVLVTELFIGTGGGVCTVSGGLWLIGNGALSIGTRPWSIGGGVSVIGACCACGTCGGGGEGERGLFAALVCSAG